MPNSTAGDRKAGDCISSLLYVSQYLVQMYFIHWFWRLPIWDYFSSRIVYLLFWLEQVEKCLSIFCIVCVHYHFKLLLSNSLLLPRFCWSGVTPSVKSGSISQIRTLFKPCSLRKLSFGHDGSYPVSHREQWHGQQRSVGGVDHIIWHIVMWLLHTTADTTTTIIILLPSD